MNKFLKLYFALCLSTVCFGAFQAPLSSTSGYNAAVMVNPSTNVLTSPSADVFAAANRYLMYDDSKNATLSTLYATTVSIRNFGNSFSRLNLGTATLIGSDNTIYGASQLQTYNPFIFFSTASFNQSVTFSRPILVSSTATFSEAVTVDSLYQRGGEFTAENATISSLTISPQRWYAVFTIIPPERTPTLQSGTRQATTSSSGGFTVTYSQPTYSLTRRCWTDFELKAIQQGTGSSITVKFKYFTFAPGESVPGQDTLNPPFVWFSDSSYVEPRYMRKSNGLSSIYNQLSNTNGFVGGWIICVRENNETSDWFSPYNTALTWMIRFSNYTTAEVDNNGRELWRPVYPIWTTQVPTF